MLVCTGGGFRGQLEENYRTTTGELQGMSVLPESDCGGNRVFI